MLPTGASSEVMNVSLTRLPRESRAHASARAVMLGKVLLLGEKFGAVEEWDPASTGKTIEGFADFLLDPNSFGRSPSDDPKRNQKAIGG